ncbi:MAG: hypothetical protein FJ042_00865 [Candidatus Cloacimonetes bacterium]|nr:hypothetical protein [Candidatus Cloacimonadota bacterium]
MMKIWISGTIAICCLLLTACASSAFFPMPTSVVKVDDTFAIIRTDSLLVVVRPEKAMLDSQILSRNYFAIFVQIKNLSPKTISLKNTSVAVVADGFQFDPLPLDYLLKLLRLEQMTTQTDDPFNHKSSMVSIEEQQDAYVTLMRSYLVISDLMPNSTMGGYIFFANSIKGASEFILHLGQWNILYERRQKNNN